ncbi:MAG: dockerin type I repeat-containing protein [Bacteroidaceae bacterium]|nr:dockerin type I repeat-containing protein [Bacteroidaceae bacterium]
MRKLFGLLFMLAVCVARGQTTYSYRYWFDSNSAAAREGSIVGNQLSLELPVDTLTDWYHLLHFQIKDSDGKWSVPYTKPFAFVSSAEGNQGFTGQTYRYWFDIDRTTVKEGIITGNVFPLEIPIDTLSDWYHLLHFQIKDADGRWSVPYTKPFAIVSSAEGNQDLTGQTYRYWFDIDSIAVREGIITGNVFPLDISVDSLSGWYHLLHFQIQDADGRWSVTYTKPFAIVSSDDNQDLAGQLYRYWFDSDESTSVEGPLIGNIMSLDIPITSLDDGEHTLLFQVQGQGRLWSPVVTSNFLVFTHGLTILSGDGGSVIYNEEVIREDFKNYSISEGVEVELTLTPDEGYAIKSVVVDETNDVTDQVVDGKLIMTMNASMAVVVSYILTDYMKLGDVNNDGRISVADLSLTVSHLIGEQPQPFPPQQADANNDGEINAGDLARIVDLITGAVERGTHEVKGLLRASDESKPDVLSGMMTDNGVQIDLQNQAAYTTFQMALMLPEGAEVSDVRLSAQRIDNHILAKGRLEDGRLMVVVYSTDNSPLLGNEGLLLDIQTSAPVTGEVYVDDIVFVTEQGQVRKMSPFCISNATSVNGTKATTTFSASHDLGGRRITGKPHRGIYIIDGKKIIFK